MAIEIYPWKVIDGVPARLQLGFDFDSTSTSTAAPGWTFSASFPALFFYLSSIASAFV